MPDGTWFIDGSGEAIQIFDCSGRNHGCGQRAIPLGSWLTTTRTDPASDSACFAA
jgi:hypothetical protein